MPVISPRFVEALGAALAEDVDAPACTMRCQGQEFPWDFGP